MAADYFRQSIRVNAVCPSGTLTRMLTDVLRQRAGDEEELAQRLEMFQQSDQGLSTPEDIAPAYLYLASDQLSRKVTGHILMVDNGFSMMRC
jgi:NAD(P)-dependent dehydrogenase (short-subunit alcohol dehydrogenase family)